MNKKLLLLRCFYLLVVFNFVTGQHIRDYEKCIINKVFIVPEIWMSGGMGLSMNFKMWWWDEKK